MERDKMIEECRAMVSRLNEYVKGLAELGVDVEIDVDTYKRMCIGQVQVPVRRISISFKQEL